VLSRSNKSPYVRAYYQEVSWKEQEDLFSSRVFKWVREFPPFELKTRCPNGLATHPRDSVALDSSGRDVLESGVYRIWVEQKLVVGVCSGGHMFLSHWSDPFPIEIRERVFQRIWLQWLLMKCRVSKPHFRLIAKCLDQRVSVNDLSNQETTLSLQENFEALEKENVSSKEGKIWRHSMKTSFWKKVSLFSRILSPRASPETCRDDVFKEK